MKQRLFKLLIDISHGRFLLILFLPGILLDVATIISDLCFHSDGSEITHAIGVGLCYAYGILILMVFLARFASSLRPKPGHCRHCGYDLRATPNRCPECGLICSESTGAPRLD